MRSTYYKADADGFLLSTLFLTQEEADIQTGLLTVAPPERPVVEPPPEPAAVPNVVTRRQARQALLLAGKLGDVQPAIDAIPDPIQRGMVQIEWDDSQEFHRNRPTLISLATAIGVTSEQLDALFIQAAAL
jgi:hypothetical protein